MDPTPAQELEAMASALQPDGQWKDIDYKNTDPGHWALRNHLERARLLARTWAAPGTRLSGNPAIRAAALKAFDHWLAKDYRNKNWWQNEIGVPRLVAEFLILMEEELTPEQRAKGLQIVERAKIRMTGQNRIWFAGNVLMRALLQGDVALARTARDTIVNEVSISTGEEGLQPDFSFHQHGPQLQFGNYGLAFAVDIVKWTKALRGTSLAVEPEPLGYLRDYLLQGQASVVWNGTMDINACARQLFPEAPPRKAGTLRALLADMAVADPAHAAEYQAAGERCRADGAKDAGGNRMFWRSDYMTHRTSGYFASVRMCSNRIIGAEAGNGENLKGYHLGDGAMYLYRTGEEYKEIFPVWDWRRLPGVTALQTPGPMPVLDWTGYRMPTDFAGGVSDGKLGVAAMELNRDGLTAKKSWFFFENKIVCLGAGITSEKDVPVFTSVEQCHASGKVPFASGKAVSNFCIPTLETVRNIAIVNTESEPKAVCDWAWHNEVAYVIAASGQKVVAQVEPQSGSWQAIFKAGSPTPIQQDLFSLWIDHGVKPRNAFYHYVILPGWSRGKAEQFSVDGMLHDFQVLSNSPEIQAVDTGVGRKNMARILAVFFQQGRLSCNNDQTLSVDQPCLLLLTVKDGQVSITAADPTQKLKTVKVTWNATVLEIPFPQGAQAGSSVTKTTLFIFPSK